MKDLYPGARMIGGKSVGVGYIASGLAYLQHWVLPNFFFHATTTYALLRHAGVELGKGDFLAAA